MSKLTWQMNGKFLTEILKRVQNDTLVMLNLVQHLMESKYYDTLKQVQGDKIAFMTQSLKGEEGGS